MDGSGESSGVEDLGAESAMDEFSSGVNSESSGVESGGEPSPGQLVWHGTGLGFRDAGTQ